MDANNSENSGNSEPKKCDKVTSFLNVQLTWQKFFQTIILIISLLAYSSVIAFFTSLEYTKSNISKDLDLTENTFDNTIAVFFAFNSIGLFGGGWLGDRYSLKVFIVTGLVCLGCSSLIIGTLGYFDAIQYWQFLGLVSLCGIFRISVQTGFVSSLINWFELDNIGFVMGIFSASQLAGNLFGLMFFQQYNIYVNVQATWAYTIISTAAFIMFNSLIVALFFKSAPEDKDVPLAVSISQARESGNVTSSSSSSQFLALRSSANPLFFAPPINLWIVIKNPMVLVYSIVFFLLTLADLGTILHYIGKTLWPNEFGSEELLTLGGIFQVIGAIAVGLLSDKIGRRKLIAAILLLGAALLLLLLIVVQYGSILFTTTYFAFSFCFGVPFRLIPTAFVADMSKSRKFSNRRAASTIAGVINGFGSIGVIVRFYFINKIASVEGLFGILAGILVLAASISINGVFYEYRARQKSRCSSVGVSLPVNSLHVKNLDPPTRGVKTSPENKRQ